MNTDVLISLVVILLPLSFIAERISNLIKMFLPTNGFLGIGNVRFKEDDATLEKMRERRIFVISLIAGEIVAFALKADLFTILNDGKFGWAVPTTGIAWIVGCVFTGFFLSWGSKFWHDLLGILLEMKNIRKANVDEKNLEVKKKEIENQKLAQPCDDSNNSTTVTPPLVPDKPEPIRDKTTQKRIDKLHPLLREEVKQIYEQILERKVSVRFTDTLRTVEEQNELYAQGRTKPGKIVTNAKGGQSYHNFGLALDFCLLLNDGKEAVWDRNTDMNNDKKFDWDEVVAVFKHYGWEWGGDWTRFKDYPHFQKTFGYSTADLLKMYTDKKVDANGFVVLND